MLFKDGEKMGKRWMKEESETQRVLVRFGRETLNFGRLPFIIHHDLGTSTAHVHNVLAITFIHSAHKWG